MNNSAQDRRRHLRLQSNVPLKISGAEFDVVTETKNISCSGAYCRVNKYLEPMTKLKINLLLPIKKQNKIVTKKITCQGVIVRCESTPADQSYNIAIYFNDIQQKDINILNDYINSVLENSQPSKAQLG